MITKGEWKTRQLFNGLGKEVYIVEADGLLIARNLTEANAQLIAQSPRMYEALKLTRDNLQTLSDATIHYEKTFKANLVVLNQALAKVES